MVLISDNILIEIVILISIILTLIYQYLKYHYSYWTRKGIECVKPNLIFGNLKDTFLGRDSLVNNSKRLYDAIKGPFGGVYMLIQPTLFVKDPELIRHILIKDFDAFVDRGLYVNEKHDPLTGHLFALAGERWRFMRNKISPTFTSGKLKHMTSNLISNGQRLQKYFDNLISTGNNIIESHNIMSRYTIDSIALLAFGIETDCINNVNEKFLLMGMQMAKPPFLVLLKQFVFIVAPQLLEKLKFRVTECANEDFIRSITEQTLELRENKRIVRHDFMQLMVQLRNAGVLNDDGSWDIKINKGNILKFVIMF